MIFVRSAIFNVLFYFNLLVQIVPAFVAMFLWRTAMLDVARFWTRTNLWLLRVICDIRVEFRGRHTPARNRCASGVSLSLVSSFTIFRSSFRPRCFEKTTRFLLCSCMD